MLRRAWLLVPTLAACGSEGAIVLTQDVDVLTSIALEGARSFVYERDATRLELPLGSVEIDVLHYPARPSALALGVGADGAVEEAPAAAEPNDRWPLPPPLRGHRWVPGAEAFEPLDAPSLLELAARIEVEAPSCGELTVVESTRIDVSLGRQAFRGLASVGDTVVITTDLGVMDPLEPGRAFRWRAGGEAEELELPVALHSSSRLNVFADGADFLLVETSTAILRTYRLGPTGPPALRSAVASSTRAFSHSAHWPGTRELYVARARRGTILRVDLDAGVWTEVARLPALDDPRCHDFEDDDAFVLEAPDRGFASFAGVGVTRFSRAGRGAAIVEGLELGSPCQSAYARLPDGAELVEQSSVIPESQSLERRAAWRPSADAAWAPIPFAVNIGRVTAVGEQVAALDTSRDDVVLLGHDPRRPDQPPRICNRLHLGMARRLSFDGEQGFALARDNPAAPSTLVHYRLAER